MNDKEEQHTGDGHATTIRRCVFVLEQIMQGPQENTTVSHNEALRPFRRGITDVPKQSKSFAGVGLPVRDDADIIPVQGRVDLHSAVLPTSQ
eukprot:gene6545-biopygen13728